MRSIIQYITQVIVRCEYVGKILTKKEKKIEKMLYLIFYKKSEQTVSSKSKENGLD